jgi:uncharacterized protein (DUF362 family)
MECTRRRMLQLTALAPALRPLVGQTIAGPTDKRSTVSLIKGDSRRKNVLAALEAIDKDIRPVLKTKKYVLIKPNFVSTTNQLAGSHAEAMDGILDYLAPRFKGPVLIAESSAGDTNQGFDNFGFRRLVTERKSQKVELVDLNREGKYKKIAQIDFDLHSKPARFAARFFDPDAFILNSCMLKTHNTLVATLSIKNMGLGGPLHSAPNETPRWNDKRITHNGLRQTNYNVFLAALSMKPFWGATLIDGFEGMEGNGPSSGTPVDHRIAIASADYVAADRVGVEAMGIDPKWLGYLNYCGDFGVGQYDLSKIDVIGAKIADVAKKYQLHRDIERELKWQGPMTELPAVVG